MAHHLLQSGDPGRALEQIEALSPVARFAIETQIFEADLLGILGRYKQQIVIYRRLLRKSPKNVQLWTCLGHALKYAGQPAAAVEALRKAVALVPSYGEAWWSLANMKSFRFSDREVAAMRAALDSGLSANDALHFHFSLGKALEDRGEFEESFKHYAEGNRIRAGGFAPAQMKPTRFTDYVDGAIATFSHTMLHRCAGSGHSASNPIFIVGLQRSGSTLVEQILASHPLIEGTSELEIMLQIWTELSQTAARSGSPVWQVVKELSPQRLSELGAEYMDRARSFRTTDRPFFIDKRPANWMYTGLIRIILPNAKIIDVRRHPLACCLSNFKQHYSAGVPFSYDLTLIGNYYAEYLRLMKHFDEVQPKSVHHLLHERLVESPEMEIRRLLAFVGVPFDRSCLEFHRNRREVRTASAEQVRRPINRDGVDQWRRYEPWLQPLKQALGGSLETWSTLPRDVA
jgi:tetratricopeptide (TPR) repeat protein